MKRPERLRKNPFIRKFVQESELRSHHLVSPLFLTDQKQSREISSMPGVFNFSLEDSLGFVERNLKKGVSSFMLFGVLGEERKDDLGSNVYDKDGPVIRALEVYRRESGDIVLFADTCLCEYTSHGHCGPLKQIQNKKEAFRDNNKTLDQLEKAAIAYAQAGADVVAPSGMVDGMVKRIREGLDKSDYSDVSICSYAVKYASAFYGPFRDAAACAPKSGDRKAYQMDPRNFKEAIREAELDLDEGADYLLVKPALTYLDIVRKVSEISPVPVGAYQVSGEYSMIKAAAQKGLFDEEEAFKETLLSMRRAGAQFIITYWAEQAAELINEGRI